MKKIFLFLLPAAVLLAGCTPKESEPEVLRLSVEPGLITCPDAGGDYTVTVISPNGAWTATPSDSWIRVNPASGGQGSTEVRIRIDTNKESAETQGKITFVSGEEKVEMPVSRAAKAAPYLRVVSEKELNTPKEGGSYTVQVESNIKWPRTCAHPKSRWKAVLSTALRKWALGSWITSVRTDLSS